MSLIQWWLLDVGRLVVLVASADYVAGTAAVRDGVAAAVATSEAVAGRSMLHMLDQVEEIEQCCQWKGHEEGAISGEPSTADCYITYWSWGRQEQYWWQPVQKNVTAAKTPEERLVRIGRSSACP
eukprot:4883617-Amphidinium_carterae.1